MKYAVTFPEDRPFTGEYLSVEFKDGKGQTDSDYLADRFKKKGLTVEPIEEKPIEKLTTAELEEIAKAENIDFAECKTNADRVAAILAAREAPPKE